MKSAIHHYIGHFKTHPSQTIAETLLGAAVIFAISAWLWVTGFQVWGG